jgi:hypothetical protein
MKQFPAEPGLIKSGETYGKLLETMMKLPNVKSSWPEMKAEKPFITGTDDFDYWCRISGEGLYIFFANPKARNLKFPLEYGQSLNTSMEIRNIEIHYLGATIPVQLSFDPYQSILLQVDNSGKVSFIDISFTPKTPVYIPRENKGRERWEVIRNM